MNRHIPSLLGRPLLAVLTAATGLPGCADRTTAEEASPTSELGAAPEAESSEDASVVASEFTLMGSTVTREEPSPSDEVMARLASDQLAFTINLYHEMLSDADHADANIFFSPYSIWTALAMTYVGARGQTKDEMRAALNFTLEEPQLHEALNALDRTLVSRRIASEGESPGVQLQAANDIWASVYEEERPLPSFVDTLARHYGIDVKLVDFLQTDKTRQIINNEIARLTRDTIPKLIPDDVIDASTTLVLTNALYFKAGWLTPFSEHETVDDEFENLDGSTTTVDVMHGLLSAEYGEDESVQVLRLPYEGEQLALLLVLPKPGQFTSVEAELSPERVSQWRAMLQPALGDVFLPKLDMRSPIDLQPPLKALGMNVPFCGAPPPGADFSGIGPAQECIQDIVHEGFIAIDETGTEAGAATAVVLGESAAPTPEFEFMASRPFLLVLEDIETATPLFAGRYVAAEE